MKLSKIIGLIMLFLPIISAFVYTAFKVGGWETLKLILFIAVMIFYEWITIKLILK